MKTAKIAVVAILVLWCSWEDANAQGTKKKPTGSDVNPLPSSLIQSWKTAGADFGWMTRFSVGTNFVARKLKPTDIPAFRWKDWAGDGLKNLPVPDEGFGIKFDDGKVSDEDLRQVARFRNLNALSIRTNSRTNISDKGIGELSVLSDLRWLDFGGQKKITDVSLKVLGKQSKLEVLGLHGTSVTDAGLKEIGGLSQLEGLNLNMTPITGIGFRELIASRKKLKALHLESCQLSDDGLREVSGFKGLGELVLNSNGGLTDVGIKHLASLKSLGHLDVAFTGITDVGLKELTGLTQIWSLDLSSTRVTDAGLKHIAGLKKLTSLHIENTKVTEAGLRQLKRTLPQLKILKDGK